MKKVSAVMFSLVLLSTMAACGSNNGNIGNEQVSVRQTETDTEDEAEEIQNEAEIPAADAEEEITPDEPKGSNVLIAYFSRVGNMEFEEGVDAVTSASVNIEDDDISGNARLLAQMALKVTGGDMFFIETVEKYPAAYRGTTDQAKEEQNDDVRPELASHVENMDAYDTIVLIYPLWWGTLPQPVFTFLEEYDFSGKTILPLCTHEGSRLGAVKVILQDSPQMQNWRKGLR